VQRSQIRTRCGGASGEQEVCCQRRVAVYLQPSRASAREMQSRWPRDSRACQSRATRRVEARKQTWRPTATTESEQEREFKIQSGIGIGPRRRGNGQRSGGRECRDAFAYGRRAGPGTSDTHRACPHEEDGVSAHSTSSLFPHLTLCQSRAYPEDRGRCSPGHSRAPSLNAPGSRHRIHSRHAVDASHSSPPTRCSAARCKPGRARARYYLHSTVARQRATRPRRSVGTTLAWFISAQRVALWEPQPLYAASLGRHVVTVWGLDYTRSLPMCQRLPPCVMTLALIKRLFAVFVFANTPSLPR
jgi:hypothetical protein